jgi:hypothetical protein
MRHDVETVEDMDRLSGLLGDDLEVGLLHVRAHKAQGRTALAAKPPEEAQQGLDPALLADPQQSLAIRIDLIHQGQVAMPPSPSNLVDAERLNPRQVDVRTFR